jgi:hypothetical protein
MRELQKLDSENNLKGKDGGIDGAVLKKFNFQW